MKKISFFIYKFLKFFDNLVFFFLKKKILIYFNKFFDNDFYNYLEIIKKKTILFETIDIKLILTYLDSSNLQYDFFKK
jgi:hypothetical protein